MTGRLSYTQKLPMSAPGDPRLVLRTEIVSRQRQYEIVQIMNKWGFHLDEFLINMDTNNFSFPATHDFFSFQTADLSTEKPLKTISSRPGIIRTHEAQPTSFIGAKQAFDSWCCSLNEYLKTVEQYKHLPDLFGTMNRIPGTSELAARVSVLDQHRISDAQRELIPQQIELLRKYVIEQGKVTEANMAQLQSGMEYLVEASNRVGSKDWLNLLMATMVAFILSSLFDPARGEELIQYAFGLFQFLFGSQLLR